MICSDSFFMLFNKIVAKKTIMFCHFIKKWYICPNLINMDKSNDCSLVTNTMSKAKDRDSNIELLRIISMLLVMIVHADYLALGAPSVEEISTSYSSSFVRAYIEALSCICVNVFILISGWFGVRPKIVRLIEFVFQVLFIYIVTKVSQVMAHLHNLT